MKLFYLDPGSGSFLIQLVIAALAGVALAIGAGWNKIKSWFHRSKNTDKDDME